MTSLRHTYVTQAIWAVWVAWHLHPAEDRSGIGEATRQTGLDWLTGQVPDKAPINGCPENNSQVSQRGRSGGLKTMALEIERGSALSPNGPPPGPAHW
ncbi:hypothetical protein BHE90_017235 [Fusarium euwallaceae]|uniref:Uncharacterized protein n=1 Tax=Fusarium euwallaceae TaxID=1147111 RepID=A0A430KY15_9HYPO|nr:hypothetical protein BHE90_017235 [Fusarium euwallaceae]